MGSSFIHLIRTNIILLTDAIIVIKLVDNNTMENSMKFP